MKRKIFLAAISVFFIFSYTAHSAFFWKNRNNKETVVEQRLDETSWILISMKEKNRQTITVDGKQRILLNFNQGRITGNTGLNTYSASYKNKNSNISIKDLSITQVSGSEYNMNLEEKFIKILKSSKKISYDDNILTLSSGSGDLLTFRNIYSENYMPEFSEYENNNRNDITTDSRIDSGSGNISKDVMNTEWQVIEMNGKPVSTSSYRNSKGITVNFSSGNKISGNGGINSYFGNYRINGENITITSALGSTKMDGPDDLIDMEIKFLNALQNVQYIRMSGKDTLILVTDIGETIILKKIK